VVADNGLAPARSAGSGRRAWMSRRPCDLRRSPLEASMVERWGHEGHARRARGSGAGLASQDSGRAE
jgi:hypothetical protein